MTYFGRIHREKKRWKLKLRPRDKDIIVLGFLAILAIIITNWMVPF